MTTAITFRVWFFAPLTSAAALGRDGIDIALHADPIGGDGIKGAMRRAGARIVPEDLWRLTFGEPEHPAPWHWSGLLPETEWEPSDRHRVQIDPRTGAAETDQLVRAEYVWPTSATFMVTPTGSAQMCERTRPALVASARAVTALGAWSARAYGWVRVVPLDDVGNERQINDQELDLIWEWVRS